MDSSGKFQPSKPANAAVPDPAARLAQLGIRIEGDRLMIGSVEIDRRSQTVSLPAKVRMVDGTIEYLLVHSNGKVHESLLVTDAPPQDIHIACLLAGLAGAKDQGPCEVVVEVTWETNGPTRKEPAGNLVSIGRDHPQGKSGDLLSSGTWTYGGSVVDAGGFAATREGSIVSLITDGPALVSNPSPSRGDDTLHVPNSKSLPATGYPVRVLFRKPASETQTRNP